MRAWSLAVFAVAVVACTPASTTGLGDHRPDVEPSSDEGLPTGTSSNPTRRWINASRPQDLQAPGVAESGTSPTDLCFADVAGDPSDPTPDYDQFGPVLGSHCNGTDHQDIVDVERVVFIGDSVTVGTPPTLATDYYRNRVADTLAGYFGLDAPGVLWETVDVFTGTTIVRESGDFASCAEWGARADDLLQDGTQLEDCLPASERDKTTLVVMTVGGNDLAGLSEGFMDGFEHAELWSETELFMAQMRTAVEWITSPGRFPNGVYVIMTNLYEYTDGTGDVEACPAAALAGMTNVSDPELPEMVVWAMEEYMSIAVDTDTDMLFLLEQFCGHGYNRDDPNGPCYRGPDAELWFDLTCIHPNSRGHEVMAEMFLSVVQE